MLAPLILIFLSSFKVMCVYKWKSYLYFPYYKISYPTFVYMQKATLFKKIIKKKIWQENRLN